MAVRAAAFGGAALTFALMLYASNPFRGEGGSLVGWLLLAVPYWIWGASPYVAVYAAARVIGRRRTSGARTAAVLALLGILLAVVGNGLYVQTLFVAPPDAQSGLVFLVVPFYQWVATLLCLAVVAFAGRGGRWRGPGVGA